MDNQELLSEKELDLKRRQREFQGLRDLHAPRNGHDGNRDYYSRYLYEDVDETPKFDLGIQEHLDQKYDTKDLEVQNVEEAKEVIA